jgi:hypothetical protein
MQGNWKCSVDCFSFPARIFCGGLPALIYRFGILQHNIPSFDETASFVKRTHGKSNRLIIYLFKWPEFALSIPSCSSWDCFTGMCGSLFYL